MKKWLVVVAAFAAVAVYVWFKPPEAVQRIRYPLHYRPIVTGHARNYHLDPALLAAVIDAESKFNADAKSSSGAIGLMQLLPDTAHGIALHTGGGNFHPDTDLLVPDLNVRYGCWYLQHLQQKYAAYQNSTELALAAYNAGQANVDRWIAQTPAGGTVKIPFPETRDYVADVERLQKLYRRAYHSELYG